MADWEFFVLLFFFHYFDLTNFSLFLDDFSAVHGAVLFVLAVCLDAFLTICRLSYSD